MTTIHLRRYYCKSIATYNFINIDTFQMLLYLRHKINFNYMLLTIWLLLAKLGVWHFSYTNVTVCLIQCNFTLRTTLLADLIQHHVLLLIWYKTLALHIVIVVSVPLTHLTVILLEVVDEFLRMWPLCLLLLPLLSSNRKSEKLHVGSFPTREFYATDVISGNYCTGCTTYFGNHFNVSL